MTNRLIRILLAVGLLASAAGCGSSSTSTSTRHRTPPTRSILGSRGRHRRARPSAHCPARLPPLPPATFPTPAFLTFHNPGARYRHLLPGGLGPQGHRRGYTLVDKNNGRPHRDHEGAGATPSSVLRRAHPAEAVEPVADVHPPGDRPSEVRNHRDQVDLPRPVARADPVTGKTVSSDRRPVRAQRRRQTGHVDLGTAKGVDNVDAYRMMISSFRWQ